MKSTLLIAATLLAISRPVSAMEREPQSGSGFPVDPISTAVVVAVTTVSTIYSAYNQDEPRPGEILLVVDAEQELAGPRNLMTKLCSKLAALYKPSHSTASRDLAWLYTVKGIFKIIEKATDHAALGSAGSAAWNAAFNLAFNTSDSIDDAASEADAARLLVKEATQNPAARKDAFYDAHQAVTKAVGCDEWYSAWNVFLDEANKVGWKAAREPAIGAVERGATHEEVGLIACQTAQKAILNWLFENINRMVEMVFPAYLKELDDNPDNNPFASNEALVPFVNEYFGNLQPEGILFVAPWLVLIVPINAVPQVHQPLFLHLRAMLIWPRVSQLMLRDAKIENVSEIPWEIVEIILVTFFEVMGPQPR